MLSRLILSPKAVNRLAAMSILPLMVLAIVGGANATSSSSSSPREPVEAPRIGTLIVAGLRSDTLTIHDLGGFGQAETLHLTSPAHEIALLNGRLYVTLPREDQVAEIDPNAPGILRTVEAGPAAHGITVSDGQLLVTLDDAASVVTLDPTTMTTGQSWTTGNTPHVVATDGDFLFVTDSRDNTLRRINRLTGETKTVTTAAMPESIVITGERVVTAGANDGVLRWYTKDLQIAGYIELGGQPVRIIALDEHRVAVALNAAEHVAIVDLRTATLEERVRVAPRPDGMCLSPNGRFLAVASNAADGVNIFRTTDWRLMITLDAGDGPGACSWY